MLNIEKQTLVTANHQCEDNDIAYLLDADLAILGCDWLKYQQYSQVIQQEYSIYNDADYANGRVRVLQQFLAEAQIYQTPHFYKLYEVSARANLHRELTALMSSAPN